MKRKILSLVMAIAMLTTLFVPAAFAEGETLAPVTKEMVNVAINKYVYSGGGNAGPSGAAQMLTDGRKSTATGNEFNKSSFNPNTTVNDYSGKLPSGKQGTVSTAGTNDWFMLDLGRQFKIKEVRLYAPGAPDESAAITANQAGYVANVEIQGSNTEDFTSYDTLLDIEGNATWDHYPYYAVTQSEVKPYRYIRLQKTGGGYYGFSEMEVFADVTVSEISKNKKASIDLSAEDSYTVTGVTDGIETVIGWENADTSATAKYMVLDLEKEYPVSMLEMVSGPYGTACNHWSIYGSTAEPTAETLTTTGKLLIPTLHSGNAANGYTSNYVALHPVYPNMLSLPTYDIGKTRYITLYKAADRVQLREVRAYVMHPEVYGVEVGENITVAFSDDMNAETLSASTIALKNKTTDETIDLTDKISASENSFAISGLTLPVDNEFVLTVSKNAENTKGVSLAADYTYDFDTYTAPSEVPYTKTVNKNVAINKYVYSGGGNAGATAQLLTDGRRNIDYANAGGIQFYPNGAGSEETALLPSGAKGPVASGQADDWFMVDLGREYEVTGVKLYDARAVVADESGEVDALRSNDMRYVEIQGSNTETFDDYDTLAEIGDTVTWDHLPCLEETLKVPKYYRYIRLQKTASSYYGFSELEVFANVNLTEVSRNKAVEASYSQYGTVPETTVDGAVAGSWLIEGGATAPHYMILDLGEELPVSWIEMVARVTTADNAATRNNWSVYGSIEKPEADTMTNGTLLIPKLHSVFPGNYSILFPKQADGELSLPLNSNAVNDNYRYITFYKSEGYVALSEVRAFVTAPELTSVYGAYGSVTLNFSEAMAPASLNERSIKIYNSADEEIEWTGGTLNGNSFTISGLSLTDGETYKVVVNNLAKNARGVMVAPWNEASFVNTAEYAINGFKFVDSEGEEISGPLSKTADDVKVKVEIKANAEPVQVMFAMALYNGKTLKEVKYVKATVGAGTSNIFSFGENWTEETDITKVKAFMWDENMNPYFGNLEAAVE